MGGCHNNHAFSIVDLILEFEVVNLSRKLGRHVYADVQTYGWRRHSTVGKALGSTAGQTERLAHVCATPLGANGGDNADLERCIGIGVDGSADSATCIDRTSALADGSADS